MSLDGLTIWGPIGPNISPETPTPGGESALSDIDDLDQRGPLLQFHCATKDPIAAMQHWLAEVRANTPSYARDGKGLTFNYDPAWVAADDLVTELSSLGLPTKGRLVIWADGAAGSVRANNPYNGRKMGTYVVNGGKASCVYGFTPTIKWHWNAILAGGGLAMNSGHLASAPEGLLPGLFTTVENLSIGILGGVAPAPFSGMPTNSGLEAGSNPQQNNLRSVQENFLTNSLHDTIEAELRVQGDPSFWLCTPFAGAFRNVAIIVVNPFFMNGSNNNGCPDWSQVSPCHDLLTNRNWWIKGVEHHIKEGSYITTIKVALFFPPADIPPWDPSGNPIGISGDSDAAFTFLCEQGTMNCPLSVPWGGEDHDPGIGGYGTDGKCIQPPGISPTFCNSDFEVG
jgi:hypothetical protein